MTPPSPTGLQLACRDNDMELVKGILKAPRHCWEEKLDGGLVGAVENSNRPLIQLLRSKKARFNQVSFLRLCSQADLEVYQDVFGPTGLDVNTTEFGGECALRLSIKNIDAMEWLLARGADPNLVGERGATPMDTAIASGRCDAMDVLLSHGAVLEDGILHRALWVIRYPSADISIVKHLISKGANVNAVASLRHPGPKYTGPNQRERGTPLHLAAKLNLSEAAQVLLDAGADPNVVASGQTPCELAKAKQKPKVYELLSSLAQ